MTKACSKITHYIQELMRSFLQIFAESSTGTLGAAQFHVADLGHSGRPLSFDGSSSMEESPSARRFLEYSFEYNSLNFCIVLSLISISKFLEYFLLAACTPFSKAFFPDFCPLFVGVLVVGAFF